jgi:hypothetical protein
MADRYWIATDFGKVPVPFDTNPYNGEPIVNRVGRNLKPDERAALDAASKWWALGCGTV